MRRAMLVLLGVLPLVLLTSIPAQAFPTVVVKGGHHQILVSIPADEECESYVIVVNSLERASGGERVYRIAARPGVKQVTVWALCENGGASNTWVAFDGEVRVRR